MQEVKKNQNKPSVKSPEKTTPSKAKESQFKETFALGKTNYILIAIGLLLIIIGFILMAAKGNINSFIKIDLSVIFIMAGFFLEIFAIMKKPKE
jgi:hypothetical protein